MRTIGNDLYRAFVQTLRQQEIIPFVVVFGSILAVLELNQYLFFHFNTSPAVILMPVGVGLAAVYLGGYRMWLPIACAWFFSALSSPAQPSIFLVVVAALAYPLQAVLGGYVLRRLKFMGRQMGTGTIILPNAWCNSLEIIEHSCRKQTVPASVIRTFCLLQSFARLRQGFGRAGKTLE